MLQRQETIESSNVGVTIPIVSSLIEDTRPLKAPA